MCPPRISISTFCTLLKHTTPASTSRLLSLLGCDALPHHSEASHCLRCITCLPPVSRRTICTTLVGVHSRPIDAASCCPAATLLQCLAAPHVRPCLVLTLKMRLPATLRIPFLPLTTSPCCSLLVSFQYIKPVLL
ncbi:hypothetical protein K503DRAFT_865094 [Rhizopogon vinicolor AM-OR11-026]|uniref:Uncharacterized protein n=1 Tax=Rhizopogon vinicolor AM-OR11-026 TaxID=1314800 RepID=A0A1B7N4R5_9AGAM|nr:hypothetical protein K503DRAFT_865094 [Rhizopogon vinicolor AM-OR11-026]